MGLLQHVALMLQQRTDAATVGHVADKTGTPHPFRTDADTRISIHQEAAFVEAACVAADDIDFGIAAGLALDHGTSLPGYISEHSKTLRHALQDAARLLPLVRPGMDFAVAEPGNAASLRLTLSDPALYQYPRHVECVYAGVIGQIRAFTMRPFFPEQLSFQHDR